MKSLQKLLMQESFSREEIVRLLSLEGEEKKELFLRSRTVKLTTVGNKVYFRGLIEFSNICAKDCLYCGIRSSNTKVVRYFATDDQILDAARFAFQNQYSSVVLQSGELSTPAFIDRVDNLLKKIKALSDGKLGITLSCGEQTENTYQRWFDSGAHRYLLRIETSNKSLYEKIHPKNEIHRFEKRLEALNSLRRCGYQVGSGMMIGLPFQTLEDMADDLLFLQKIDVDMVGMGPYIEHEDTPLIEYRHLLSPRAERFDLALKMIAVLRLMMPDINIAAATALQAIDPVGREKAVQIGANVIMPNLTPCEYREEYKLYENKPCLDEDAEACKSCLEARISMSGDEIGYGEWGDSRHFARRKDKKK
ncbi:MAG: [FeFe] hydrogenase H-cluster radical SAM maturase HydE [Bacteroidota bacterium]|nr:[FeFe] hydrogenase H-cluster radical SAM maturase HydE [Bacteroidota bacterium]